MPSGTSPANRAIEAKRRELVAALRARGQTEREIVESLIELRDDHGVLMYPGISQPTIHRDCVRVKAQWLASSNALTAEHAARQVAELAEVKRAAWSEKDYDAVRKAISTEADILGTKAALEIKGFVNLSDDELLATAARLFGGNIPAEPAADGPKPEPVPNAA